MNLKNAAFVAVISTVLQGCATPGPDLSKLPVYPDNRVGFTMSSDTTSSQTRVWVTGETILALQVGERLLNAKDIDSLAVQPTGRKDLPLHVILRLKSGENLVTDVDGWGRKIDWLACDRSRVCEYLDRRPSMAGLVSFKNAGNFLTSFDESFLERGMSDAQIRNNFRYTADYALPYADYRSYQLKFEDPSKIADLDEASKAGQAKRAQREKCNAEAVAAEQRSQTRSTSSAQPRTSDMVGWLHGCQ